MTRHIYGPMGTYPLVVPATDPFFANVVLLLPFQGANGSTGSPGLTDFGPLAKGTATVTGTTNIDTSQFKFGSSSLFLNGGKISFPDSTDWEFSGPFTVEAWIRPNALVTSSQIIVSHGVSSISYGWFANYTNAGSLVFRIDDNGDGTPLWSMNQGTGPTMVVNQWYFYAADRDATNTARLYLDGVTKIINASGAGATFNSAGALDIGYVGSSSSLNMTGWIGALRITKGVARYANDVGFTVPTAPFPTS